MSEIFDVTIRVTVEDAQGGWNTDPIFEAVRQALSPDPPEQAIMVEIQRVVDIP